MTTKKIFDFISHNQPSTPCLILDLDVVQDNYEHLNTALPTAEIFYAVKANPDPQVLKRLSSLGSCFDTASVAEIQMAFAAGATAEQISFGNTIKKERDIANAFDLGIRLFAVDCIEEVEKVARAAPGSAVFCRILTDGEGAEWPLSRKFGCVPEMAVSVLSHAHALGLTAAGVSFHVGSQQCDLDAWNRAIKEARSIFAKMEEQGVRLTLLNMGGGFPTRYLKDVPTSAQYGEAIWSALTDHFGNDVPRIIIEPGRGMVGSAGVIRSEVVLVSNKADNDNVRWIYLDIGKFGGLAETMDEAIRYRLRTDKDGDDHSPCIVAGPTCDSADVLYEKNHYPLPVTLKCGDEVLIEGTGAYTTTYSAVAFNGFEPLRSHVI